MLPLLLLHLACSSPDRAAPATTDDTGASETGDPCGEGPWGNVEGTIFVDASAAASGDGSEEAPFQTIGAALSVATASDVVAVAAGTYAERIALEGPQQRTVAGRCAELVTLDGGPDAPDFETLVSLKRSVTLRLSGVSLDAWSTGLRALQSSVELRDVVVQGHTDKGIELFETDAVIEDLRILSPGDEEAPYVTALDAAFGSLTLRRASISGQTGDGLALYAPDDPPFLVEDVEIRDVGAPGDSFAMPLTVFSGAADLRRVTIADVVGVGVLVAGQDPQVDFEDLEITGIRSPYATVGSSAAALSAGNPWGGAPTVTGTGLRITDSESAITAGPGATIQVSDVYVADLGFNTTVAGVLAYGGGRLEADEVVIERASGAAVWAAQDGTVVLRDAEVLDVQAGQGEVEDGASRELVGVAAVASDNSTLELVRTRLSGAAGVGLDVRQELGGTPTVRLEDVTIEEVGLSGVVRSAMGVLLREGVLVAEGLTVRDVAGPGIAVISADDIEASLQCSECVIEDVALAGVLVTGLAAERPVRLDGCIIAGVALDDSSGLSTGLLATNARGAPSLEVVDCEVSDTRHGALVVSGDGSIQVRDSTLHGGTGALIGGVLEAHGNAVYATGIGPWDGESGLRIAGSTLVPGAGETVLLHAASATLEGIGWEGGTLRQQHCDGVASVVGADQAGTVVECPDTDVVVVDIDDKPVGMPPIDGIE